MIRLLVLCLAAFGLALPLQAAAPVRQWDSVATPGPQNSWIIGNPRAPVRVTEYLSYTCPHCAEFSAESDVEFRQGLIRQGRVSWEIRNLYRDPLDLAETVVARCRPQRMAAVGAAFFAQQDAILARFNDLIGQVSARNATAAHNVLLKDMAVSAGLFQIAQGLGVTRAQLDACFATRADIDRIDAQRRATPAAVNGTPTFALNGRLLTVNTWSGVREQLAAAHH